MKPLKRILKHVRKNHPSAGPDHASTDASSADLRERGLEAIYITPNGSLPNLSVLDRTSPRGWLGKIAGLIILLLLVGCAGWVGWTFFQPYRLVQSDGLHVEVNGSEEIALGEEQQYEFAWSNTLQENLDHAELRLGFPPDFVVTHSDPAPTDQAVSLWELGSVPAGSSGVIRVSGFFTGALGTKTAVQAIGSYRPARTTRDQQVFADRGVRYASTVLGGNILAPQSVLSGDPVTVRYAVANLGKQQLSNLEARIVFPAGFLPGALPTSTQVDLGRREVTYAIGSLDPGTFFTAPLPGSFVSGMTGDAVFQAEAGRRSEDGTFLPAERAESRLSLLGGDVALRFVVNGSDTDRTVRPGDSLRMSIAYENVSGEPVKDVILTVGFESAINGVSATGMSLLDWTDLDDLAQGASSTKPRIQTIRYDGKRLIDLAEIPPRSSGTIDIAIPTLSVSTGTHDASVLLTVQGTVGRVGNTDVHRQIQARPIRVRYESGTQLSTLARYFTEEGAPVGSGALPPVVGKKTTYRVYWHVEKALHPLQNIRIRANLPNIVSWTGEMMSENGTLMYDPTTREVLWTVPTMDEDTQVLEATFDLAVSPEPVDEGRFAALLNETLFQAKDETLDANIVLNAPALNTDLQLDEAARGKGVVRKE